MTNLGFRHEDTRDGLTMLVQGSTGWDHLVASPGGTAYNMKTRTLGCVIWVFKGWNYNKGSFLPFVVDFEQKAKDHIHRRELPCLD